jgi:asparagine synthase (glutamine-hydrolysing)
MCGIAGYIGWESLSEDKIQSTLQLMKQRGPDSQIFKSVLGQNQAGQLNINFLHSRLSIIDLSDRSNQPFTIGDYTIIFNGEIYNYIEIRKELINLGVEFKTESDTEVLLQAYINHGTKCVDMLEGMWSFAIWDKRQNTLALSRDRFGEKPLYYYESKDGLYFASEVKMLSSLSGIKFTVNEKQVLRNLLLGYKSLYKNKETYFLEVEEVGKSEIVEIRPSTTTQNRLHKSSTKYWKASSNVIPMTLDQAIEGSRHHLMESIRLRLRSDVPLAFCLSGGVDSTTLASVASKIFKCDIATFSIIESDARYNELENIMTVVNDIGCKHTSITLSHNGTLDRLRKLVKYHDAPIATTTYYIHSFLSEEISNQGYKVAFSGTGADELYTGYYDHFLLHLNELRNHPNYQTYLSDWNSHVLDFIQNPILRNANLYSVNPLFRDHVFDNSQEFLSWILPGVADTFDSNFKEESFCNSMLRNRMLNELDNEIVPLILHEDDLNSMCYSVENRSPYLDTKLCDFMFSVPPEYLIMNGYGKYILRQSSQGMLHDKVRLDRQKKGFNASINSLIDLKNENVREELFDISNPIFRYINREKVINLLNEDKLPNHYSKFIFNVINLQLFLTNYQ